MSIFGPLAEAIKNQLIAAQSVAGTFSQTACIEHPLDGLREDEELQVLRVDVLMGDKTCEPLTRTLQKNAVRMDIVTRQLVKAMRASSQERTIVHGLMAYSEELDEYLAASGNRAVPGATWAKWQHSEMVVPYSPALLRNSRLFYSLFRVTYFVATAYQSGDAAADAEEPY